MAPDWPCALALWAAHNLNLLARVVIPTERDRTGAQGRTRLAALDRASVFSGRRGGRAHGVELESWPAHDQHDRSAYFNEPHSQPSRAPPISRFLANN